MIIKAVGGWEVSYSFSIFDKVINCLINIAKAFFALFGVAIINGITGNGDKVRLTRFGEK